MLWAGQRPKEENNKNCHSYSYISSFQIPKWNVSKIFCNEQNCSFSVPSNKYERFYAIKKLHDIQICWTHTDIKYFLPISYQFININWHNYVYATKTMMYATTQRMHLENRERIIPYSTGVIHNLWPTSVLYAACQKAYGLRNEHFKCCLI
jgi:hypothetical protein